MTCPQEVSCEIFVNNSSAFCSVELEKRDLTLPRNNKEYYAGNLSRFSPEKASAQLLTLSTPSYLRLIVLFTFTFCDSCANIRHCPSSAIFGLLVLSALTERWLLTLNLAK